MLNFMLAIVVNGYTDVTERALENRVARSLARDLMQVPVDVVTWLSHRSWPTKIDLLVALRNEYPDVFAEQQELVVRMDRETFHDIVTQGKHGAGATEEDADLLFDRYFKMPVLRLFPDQHQLDPSSVTARELQVQDIRRTMSKNMMLVDPPGAAGRWGVVGPLMRGMSARDDAGTGVSRDGQLPSQLGGSPKAAGSLADQNHSRHFAPRALPGSSSMVAPLPPVAEADGFRGRLPGVPPTLLEEV
eukprot:CAMPEP_0117698652 /NCGR_PEP_ID=MMETSP0804-20121206/29869_1 /TAXON_ID=1074897 /ORGANISM="Tetraselmis astigmatica, Strain CCMP880" /LENGTH=245 /DNA_ID=CAMNT_0005512969 /DNA_START=1 /DNA_END=738 /DNA_ORIENTATION=+